MSIELTVYLPRTAMPNPKEWAKAIVEAGFPAELDAKFDVDSFSGFLPCRYDGEEAGFEYDSGPIEFVDELELPDDYDFSVSFVTHSDMRELASSVVSSAVLCSISGGILVDAQADEAISSDDAISWASEMLTEIDI